MKNFNFQKHGGQLCGEGNIKFSLIKLQTNNREWKNDAIANACRLQKHLTLKFFIQKTILYENLRVVWELPQGVEIQGWYV